MIGRVEVICGCMFSGKSEELIRRLQRARYAKKKVLCVKPAIDTRYAEEEVVSHSGKRWACRPVHSALEILDAVHEHQPEVLGIEEAQFLGAALPETVRRLSQQGIRVICAGLDQDCFARPFEPMPQLLCEADEIKKLAAVCAICGQDATRSQLLIDGEPAAYRPGPVVEVGGDESYQARCRHCHEVRYEDAS